MRKLLVLATKNGDEYVIAKAQEALDKLQPLEERPETGIAAEPSLLQLPQTSIEVPTSLINKAFSQEDRLALLQEIIDKKDRTKLVDIVKWLEEETSEKKAVASYLMALGRLGGATEVAAIKPYLESSDDRVRANAVEALGMMFERYGMAEIPDLVKPALADRHNRVRANAIVAMEGKGEAAEALEQMVYSGSPTYQRSAVYAISVLNKQEHRPFLDFLSRAKDNMVQKQADEVIEFLADAESVPVLSVTKELKIGDGLTEDGFDEGDDITNLVINPWDSVLLSEEHAAILFRQGMNTKGGGARPMNSGVKQKSPSEKEEGTVAQGLAEALASTFILVTAVLFYGLAIIMIGALLWYIFVIMTEYFPDPLWSVVGCFMAVLLVAVIEGLLPRPVDGVESAVRLSRRDAPALYAMVDKIADQLRVRKPASILIHPYSEIGIYEVTPTPFLPFSSEPQLRIGLASMRALAVSQLRAIVYAELSRVQQSEKQAYLRLVRSIDGTVQQIHEKLKVCGDARVYVNPLFYGAMLYRALVRALSSSTIIRIVLDSDRNASVYAGKEVYKAALNKYSISARLFDQDLQEIIQGASTTSTAGYTENVYSYYRDFLDGLSEKRLVKLKTEIFKCAAPGDRVFPPLQRRLDAASEGSYDNEDNGPDLTQAISLLANSDKLEASFSSVFMNKFLGISRQAIAGVAKKAAGKRSDKTIADETAGDDEAVKENEDSGK
jgi:HEAT repeat protein